MPPLDPRVDFADDGASFRVRRERQLATAEPRITLAQAIVAPFALYWTLIIGGAVLFVLAILGVWLWHQVAG